MKCKYCAAPLEKGNPVCPACGKENAKSNTWKVILAIGCVLVLLVALACVILDSMGIKIGPRENDVHYRNSYTVNDKRAVRDADAVIATINGRELTNGQLQLYYWMQVYNYIQTYGDSYFDYTKPLEEQKVTAEEETNWQQYFLGMSLESWARYQVINMLAEEEGYKLSDAQLDDLRELPDQLEDAAKDDGFASAAEMLAADFGAGCSVEDYVEFTRTTQLAIVYTDAKTAELDPTSAELDAYYEENKKTFEDSGVVKGGATLVDVRHILVQLDNVAVNSDMTVSYTDKQWKTCLAEAEAILNEWKDGKATAETFGELAMKYSKDTGTANYGGLCEQVYEGEMVAPFNDWIFDKTRQKGDTGIVKTVYGYHVMYFVDSQEEWQSTARSNVIAEKLNKLIDDGFEKWPAEFTFRKMVISQVEMG